MDTLTNIPIGQIKRYNDLHVAKLTEEERTLLVNYVALTRDVTESNQLFEAFYFNLLSMRNSFVFFTNDTVKKTEHCPPYDCDFVAVNSLVINLISSAKILTEFLREAANTWLGNSTDKYKDKYNIYVSEIYDSSPNYRLLIKLRNYVQHGHFPVSFQGERFSFDVNQILDTPRFAMNVKLKIDIKNFIEKTNVSEDIIPCISLTLTIADFAVIVTDIYRKFLTYFQESVSLSYNNVKDLISHKPSIVCDYHEDFKGYIIYDYDIDENRLHVFNPKQDPNNMINEYIKRSASIYENEKNEHDKLFHCLKYVDSIKLK